ncbi:hypothetical protein [Ekhidna sp. To15]|uniref:hypothetical protein n=1 Tax=Ekhidna sp. To15 TaxID=3395267 RepID=UPI003F5264B2
MLALFVLTQAAIVPEQVADKQEQTDTEEDEVQQITKSAAVQSSSIQINLDYQSYLLTEVFYQDREKEKVPDVKLLVPSAQKALKVLFRSIISPNAP